MPAKALRGQKLADELLRVAKIFEGKYRQAFLRSVISVVRDQNLIALINDIESGKFIYGDSIDARLASVAISVKEMETLTSKAMVSSAKITNQVMSIEGSFNVVNDAFVEAAKNLSINLSTSISNSARQSLRGVIEELVSGAIPKSEALRRIMLEVGLLPTHAIAVRNYRATLLGSGTPMPKVKTLTEAYTKRLLKYRADMIARTEVARSIGIGQTEFWKQMQAQGFLPPDANRVWITSIDEKTCEFCGPMNGLVASIGGGWQTSKGYLEYPQASHPHCRCSAGITMSKPKKSQAIYKLEELEWQNWLIGKGESAGHPFRGNQWVTGFRKSGSTATLSKKYGKDFSSVSAYCKKNFGVRLRIDTDRYINKTDKNLYIIALSVAQGLDFIKQSLTPTAYKKIVSSGVKNIVLVDRIWTGPTSTGYEILGWFFNGNIELGKEGLSRVSKSKIKRKKLFSVGEGIRQKQTSNVNRLIATATATLIHEIGHSAHTKLGINSQYKKKVGGAKGKAQGLTEYATTNSSESFAESFTARILLGKKFSTLKHSTVPIFEESTDKVFKSEMQITTIQNLENVMEWIDAQEIANPESVEKGESAGHPFRGNQWTRGISGGGIKVLSSLTRSADGEKEPYKILDSLKYEQHPDLSSAISQTLYNVEEVNKINIALEIADGIEKIVPKNAKEMKVFFETVADDLGIILNGTFSGNPPYVTWSAPPSRFIATVDFGTSENEKEIRKIQITMPPTVMSNLIQEPAFLKLVEEQIKIEQGKNGTFSSHTKRDITVEDVIELAVITSGKHNKAKIRDLLPRTDSIVRETEKMLTLVETANHLQQVPSQQGCPYLRWRESSRESWVTFPKAIGSGDLDWAPGSR